MRGELEIGLDQIGLGKTAEECVLFLFGRDDEADAACKAIRVDPGMKSLDIPAGNIEGSSGDGELEAGIE